MKKERLKEKVDELYDNLIKDEELNQSFKNINRASDYKIELELIKKEDIRIYNKFKDILTKIISKYDKIEKNLFINSFFSWSEFKFIIYASIDVRLSHMIYIGTEVDNNAVIYYGLERIVFKNENDELNKIEYNKLLRRIIHKEGDSNILFKYIDNILKDKNMNNKEKHIYDLIYKMLD